MANRFVGRIKSGDIESVDDLKAEFKELAKRTHPDVAGPGTDHGAFASLRGEYESALRDFARHRFGARTGARRGRLAAGAAEGIADPGRADEALAGEAWYCLAILVGRGFPKSPRHEKEALRYEYARWRFEETLAPERRALFEDCEAELLATRAATPAALGLPLRVLRLLLEYRWRGIPAMRTEIVLALGSLRADPRVGPGCLAFALALAGELGIGAEIGPARG
jgi:hypothetical protein